jgi:hypothetical protein
MNVALLPLRCSHPFFQIVLAPAKMIWALFQRAIGFLLECVGGNGRPWIKSAKVIEGQTQGLLIGLWSYGCRFLVLSENAEKCCRGSCYWLIHAHLAQPKTPLSELARAFEEKAPREAVEMHKKNLMPRGLIERKIWSETAIQKWPPFPDLDPGVYLFFLGYSRDQNHPGNAHLFALFKGETSFLFDPDVGLSEWKEGDWNPLLDRMGSSLRSSRGGYFNLECSSCRI